MKKLLTLLLAFPLLMGMYSYSSDSDDNEQVSILGEWEFVKTYGDVEATPEAFKNYILDDIKDLK